MNNKKDFLKDLPIGTFIPFSALFPEDAPMKTRKVTLLRDIFGLPEGTYFLVENYCTDKECDCRKVMINVASATNNTILGTVGFGWEGIGYYEEWLFGDKELAKEMSGAYIEWGGIQTGLEKECLKLVTNSLDDNNYVKLIKERYRRFKESL